MLKEWQVIALSLFTVVAGIVTIGLMVAVLNSINNIDVTERAPVETTVISTPEAPQQSMTVEHQRDLVDIELQ